MEELPLGAAEYVAALGRILHRMGMHDVQRHAEAKPVRFADQMLEILRPAEGSATVSG